MLPEKARQRFFIHVKGAHDTKKHDCGLDIFPVFLKPELFAHRHVLEQFSREHQLVRDPNLIPITGFEIARGLAGEMETKRTFKVWVVGQSAAPTVYQISIFE
jgi:hypothetical protein